MIKASLGLNDDDIDKLLGIQKPVQLSLELQEEIIGMFDACGEMKSDFEILRSRKVLFSSDTEAQADEIIYRDSFVKYDVTDSEKSIIEAYRENESVTVKEISIKTGLTENYIKSKTESLIKRGYIERTDSGLIHIPPELKDLIKQDVEAPVQIFIKYSYEGPQDDRNRPFCAKMMELDRLYNRQEIELISQRLGYSVFDRRGGFWTEKGTNITHPYCRHKWLSNIVVRKGGKNVS